MLSIVSICQGFLFMANTFLAATSYLLYSNSKRTLENMENAEEFNAKILRDSPDECIEYAIVSGKLAACNGRTQMHQFRNRAINIFRDVRKYGMILLVNPFGDGEPIPPYPLMQPTFNFGLSRFKYTPFCLSFPNSTVHALISPAAWSEKLYSQSANFVERVLPTFNSSLSSVAGLFDDEFVDMGGKITIFTKVALQNGNIIIEATGDPHSPNIFTKLTAQEIIETQRATVGLNKILMAFLLASWFYMVGHIVYSDIKRYSIYKARMDLFKQMSEQNSNILVLPHISITEQGEDPIRQHRVCINCYKNDRDTVFLKCGHVCVCHYCAKTLDNTCPICHKVSMSIIAAYVC